MDLTRMRARARNWMFRADGRAELRLLKRYQGFTMLPTGRFVDTLKLCQRDLPVGDLVECGCWRGGMSAAMAETLPGRRSVLFDSFEGLPDPADLDGERARDLVGSDRLVADEKAARDAMRRSGSDYEIRRGWFESTIPEYAAERRPIAVLRLDGDWYESTMTALTHLFPLVAVSGLVLIDDYYDWEGCTRAVHDYLSAEGRTEPIRCTRHGAVHLDKLQGR